MWPIVGIAAKWIAREIVFSVAYHYGSKYVKKKMAEKKVEDAEESTEVVQEDGTSGSADHGGSGDSSKQGGDGKEEG